MCCVSAWKELWFNLLLMRKVIWEQKLQTMGRNNNKISWSCRMPQGKIRHSLSLCLFVCKHKQFCSMCHNLEYKVMSMVQNIESLFFSYMNIWNMSVYVISLIQIHRHACICVFKFIKLLWIMFLLKFLLIYFIPLNWKNVLLCNDKNILFQIQKQYHSYCHHQQPNRIHTIICIVFSDGSRVGCLL